MTQYYLNRDDAPFSEKVWKQIDDLVLSTVKSELSARKLLFVEGPFGPGFKSLPGSDFTVQDQLEEGGTRLVSSAVIPVVEIEASFKLASRDIALYEQRGISFDSGPIVRASLSAARREDEILFNGVTELGIRGLMNHEETQSIKLGSWEKIGSAMDNMIQAVNLLDAAGFHGPYTLALAPALYHSLFRLYPQSNVTELQHLETLITDGVVKAPALEGGGVLIASGKAFASIVLGQDLMAGFVGPEGRDFEFTLSESLALRLMQPTAVVTLKSAGRK